MSSDYENPAHPLEPILSSLSSRAHPRESILVSPSSRSHSPGEKCHKMSKFIKLGRYATPLVLHPSRFPYRPAN